VSFSFAKVESQFSASSRLRSFFVITLFGPFSSKSSAARRASTLASCYGQGGRGGGGVAGFVYWSAKAKREGKRKGASRKRIGANRVGADATRDFSTDRRSRWGGGLLARTFTARLAAFFSVFSRSTAAMISICVNGRFSRPFALPLFRIPWPNSTECCDEVKRDGKVSCER